MMFFFNIEESPEGQKILAGPLHKNLIGIFDSLSEFMSGKSKLYFTKINPIVEKSTFWSVYEKNIGNITSAKFLFVAPNIWGSRDRLSEEMKRLAKQNKVQTLEVDYNNSSGKLDLSGNDIVEAVNYAVDGGGGVSLHTKEGKVFDTREKESIKSISISEDKGFVSKIMATLRINSARTGL